MIDQDLVHHHLKTEGGYQTDELQHKGDQHDLPEQSPILDDGRDEPTEIELGEIAHVIHLRSEENELAGPTLQKSSRVSRSALGVPGCWTIILGWLLSRPS